MSGYVSGRTNVGADLVIDDDAVTSAKLDDSALNDNILLNGTNSSSANAGDDLILDASASSTDVGSRIMYEDGSANNERFIDSVNETDTVALVDKVLLNGHASGAGAGDALLNETGGHILYDEVIAVGVGKVLQVVQGNTSKAVASTSTSYVTTGLSVDITPTSTTSKIMVICSGDMELYQNGSTAGAAYALALKRDSTIIQELGSIGFRTAASWYAYEYQKYPIPICVLDLPASTSQITYELFMNTTSSAHKITLLGNDHNNIIAMEIGE
jgi:hypothetical protein